MTLESLLFFSLVIIFCHQVAALIIWSILEALTTNFRFRKNTPSTALVNRYPWFVSFLLSVELTLPMAMPGYPVPDVGNYGLMLSRFLWVVQGTVLFSLFYGGRFITAPNLKGLFLAIAGMLTSAAGFVFLLYVGAASPS